MYQLAAAFINENNFLIIRNHQTLLSLFKADVILGSAISLGHYEKRNFKNLLPQILASIIAFSSNVGLGICLAYSAILIPQLQESNIKVDSSQLSWIASVYPLTIPIGTVLGAYLMDKIGRLNTLKLTSFPGILSWILIATASNVHVILAGRIMAGLISSLVTGPPVVYVTEIAHKDMRGSLVALGPAFVSLGMILVYLKGWLLSWRSVAWISNIYILISFVSIFFIPESPAWLISKNRVEEARNSLAWLHKYQPLHNNQNYSDLVLEELIEENRRKLRDQKQNAAIFREFMKPTGYKPLLILSGLFFFQQFSGIYVLVFYSVTFFQGVGTNVNPYIASVMIGVIRLVMSLVMIWLLNKTTKRKLLILSSTAMSLFILASGICTLKIKNGTMTPSLVPVVLLLLFILSSLLGLLTIPWTMTAELFPLKIRSAAHSICTAVVTFLMFLAVQNYLKIEEVLGGSAGVQFFFSAVSFGSGIYIFVFLPETQGKKLSEIEDYFMHQTVYLWRKKKEWRRRRTVSMVSDSINIEANDVRVIKKEDVEDLYK